MTREELRSKIEDLKTIDEQIEKLQNDQLYYCVTDQETGELIPPTADNDAGEFYYERYTSISRIIGRMLDMAAKI